MKTALVTGVTGQGGAYLSRILCDKDYRVVGTSRNCITANLAGLEALGLKDSVEIRSLEPTSLSQVEDLIDELRPNEIYHLASPSSVSRSFWEPVEATSAIVVGTLNVLESVRRVDRNIKIFNAASTEMYGGGEQPVKETSELRPLSPYSVAKAAAYLQTKNYREAYGLFACSGILSNFESPLRPYNFVSRKIVSEAVNIAYGEQDVMRLGDISVRRDWGWTPEFMDAAWRMMRMDEPMDLVIATGVSRSVEEFLILAFSYFDLNYREYVQIDESLFRPLDIPETVGDPALIKNVVDWESQYGLMEIVREMMEQELTMQCRSVSVERTRLRLVETADCGNRKPSSQ